MTSEAAANPGSTFDWKKYMFMTLGVILFITVY